MISTPYFLIDEERLRANLEVVRRVRTASGAKVLLALKCFATWGVFDIMRDDVDGTTSSSLYEARLGHERFGGEVHAYSVGWTADEVAEVATFADAVIFNSLSQLHRLRDAAAGRPLGLRVNPRVSNSHFDLADPARRHSRLGVVDDESLAAAVPLLDGVMFHFNCENDDFASLRAGVDRILERYGAMLHELRWVSLGGGIAFTAPGYPVDEFAEMLATIARRFDLQVYLEPGEALVTSTAELVTTVVDVVHNDADIAVVDASLEAHMLDHLIYGTRPRVSNVAPGDHAVIIAGRTCLAGDEFGAHQLAAPLEVGSEVRFADAAGYTMVKGTWFNGLRRPSIAVRRLDGSVEVIREFTYDDYASSLS